MSDAEEQQQPREKTMRRMVNVVNNDTLHKSINWTTLAGTVTLAVLGYFADAKKDKADESIKGGVSREIAALREWKAGATDDLKEQAEQIGALREAVAGLKATVDILSRARPEAAQAAATVDELLRGLGSGGARKVREAAPAPEPEQVQMLQKELFAE